MIRDTRSFETQVVDAVRAINRAMGGNPSTTPARSDQNQYEVQLINALKGIAGTLSGTGLSISGGGVGDLAGYVKMDDFQALSRRVSKLEDESFFRLVDGNVTLKQEYSNLWVPGWLAAGGVGTGGGGGASALKDLTDVYHDATGVLRANGDPVSNGDVIVYDSTNQRWVAAAGGGGGGTGTVTGIKVGTTSYSPDVSGIVNLPAYPTGTVSSVALSVPTGFSVSGSPVTSSGTLAISFASGYKLPTTSKQNSWDAKQNAIADLSTIRSNAANGNTAYGWGNHALAGYAMATDLASLASRVTAVEDWFEVVTSNGVTSLKLGSNYAGLWADGWIAAGGIGSGSGGGGSSTLAGLTDVSISNRATGDVLSFDHGVGKWVNVPKSTYLSGYATQSYVSQAVANLLPNTGGTITGGDLNLVGGVLNGYADASDYQRDEYSWYVDRLGNAVFSSLSVGGVSVTPSNYVTINTAQTVTGAKTFSASLTASNGIVLTGDIVPSADLGSQLGYSNRRFSNVNGRTYSAQEINFKLSSDATKNAGFVTFKDGYMSLRTSTTDVSSSHKEILFHQSNGFYPNSSGVNLGYTGANNRWAKIYGVDADLSGDLALAATSEVTIGPVTISYDATNKALHISGTDNNQTIGLYCDGFVAAGGVQQTS